MNKGNSMKKLLLLLLTLSINSLFAQSITVQGVLRDGNNRAVADGDYTLSFSIYSDASSSNHLWPIAGGTSDHLVTVLNGVYNMDLLVGTNIVDGGSELWLEVGVNGSVMDERIRLNLSPYEYHNVTGTSNVVTGSGKIGIGTVTPEHLLHIVKNSDIDININDTTNYAFAISEDSQDNLTISKEGHVQTSGNMNARSFNDLTGNISPVGSITMFAGATAPAGWLICDGLELGSEVKYDALHAVLNYSYGGSNRSSVPDLRGKVGVGKKSSEAGMNEMGETGGQYSPTHASHDHNVTQANHSHTDYYTTGHAEWSGGDFHSGGSGAKVRNDGHTTNTGTASSSTIYEDLSSAGSSTYGNMMPYLTINYIIKY